MSTSWPVSMVTCTATLTQCLHSDFPQMSSPEYVCTLCQVNSVALTTSMPTTLRYPLHIHVHLCTAHISPCLLQGYKKRKEYIATQGRQIFLVFSLFVLCHLVLYTGPLERTAADFWSMVWMESCFTIVMVTNTVENNTVSGRSH